MTNELKLTEYIKYQQLNSNYQSNGIELSYAWDYSIEEKFFDLALTENLSIGDKFKAIPKKQTYRNQIQPSASKQRPRVVM